MSKDLTLIKDYSEIFVEYERLRHMKEICLEQSNYFEGYFLPHHMVVKASLSLNYQYFGPTLQPSILSVLLRFKRHKYVMMADISKMSNIHEW